MIKSLLKFLPSFLCAVNIHATGYSPDVLVSGLLPSSRECTYPRKEQYGAAYISASFIFWQAKQGKMDFAAKNEGPDKPVTGVKNLNMEISELTEEIKSKTDNMPFRKSNLSKQLSKRPIFVGYT